MRKLFALCLLVSQLTFIAAAKEAAREPQPGVLGIRLGMKEEAARRRLRQIAEQMKEEKEAEGEGEQEIWTLRDKRRFDYLLVRFDNNETLWSLTAVVRPSARMKYSELGDLKSAREQTDGRNYTYTWTVPARGRTRPGYVVAARGSDPQYLTSFSISLVSE